jgi:peptidoglycan/xylan/chitin deacetylase (PgdA/CDA1 family)
MLYFVKKPKWVRKFYGDCTWEIKTAEKVLYLTFDDGPDREETPFVLEQLEKYNAKATFFCLGQNVVKQPQVYRWILSNGHSVGNHTFSHIDGWKSSNKKYFEDIKEASNLIYTKLFRPPYGHITWNQVNWLKSNDYQLKTILWNLLSADFDKNISKEKCLHNVIDNATKGSIILFHDSSIASKNMRYALPRVLDHFSAMGYYFQAL